MSSNARLAAGIAALHPSVPAQDVQWEPPLKTAAAAHGFTDRDPVTPRKRQRGTDAPTCSFTARVTVADHDAFVAWCEAERMSYREAFARLVGMIGRT